MKRDELYELMRDLRDEVSVEERMRLYKVMSWLERLPVGCELVGFRPEINTLSAVWSTGCPRGMPYDCKATVMNPDDITKAGSQPRRCPRHGAYERVCQECLDEQRGKR